MSGKTRDSAGLATAKWPPAADCPHRGSSGGVADFYGHLLAQSRQGSLDFFCLRSMLGIEHTADHSLVDPKASRQLGVVDLLLAHRQVERQFRREPKRHW